MCSLCRPWEEPTPGPCRDITESGRSQGGLGAAPASWVVMGLEGSEQEEEEALAQQEQA